MFDSTMFFTSMFVCKGSNLGNKVEEETVNKENIITMTIAASVFTNNFSPLVTFLSN